MVRKGRPSSLLFPDFVLNFSTNFLTDFSLFLSEFYLVFLAVTGRPEERRRCFIPYGVASAQGFLFTQRGSLEKHVATSFSTSSSPFPYKKKAASS